jgi:type IV secretory pathway TraG/TraD family ATPase VirD4
MSKLLIGIFKFFGKCAKNITRYTYAQRLDLRKGTGLLHSLLTGVIGTNKGARFARETEQLHFLSSHNKGLLIDGKSKRLSLNDSFQHLLVVAPTGAGKTSRFILPNIYTLAKSQNSIIATDPSGELFHATSGYLQSQGFKVLKFDPADPERSLYFNPLRYVFSYAGGKTEIDQTKATLLATSLIASSLPDKRDFWAAGAENIIEFLIACLQEAPREYHNLYNVYKLAEAITPTGELLIDFMATYGNAPSLKAKWQSLLSSSNETFQSQLVTALTALKHIGNTSIAKMLSKNSIRFSDLRKEKTIIYLTFPVNQASSYTFILNLFYTQLFFELMHDIPQKADLPLFVLYDEFGHANIPNFDAIVTNIRKYKVSLSLVLQSFSQLYTQYGETKAKTILEGGVNSKLFYSGANLDTARLIEQILGKVIREETYTANSKDERTSRTEYNLLNADEIRTLPDNKAFFITGN